MMVFSTGLLTKAWARESDSTTTTTATAVISGGRVGSKEPVACRITTAGGRVAERTFYLKIVQR